MTKVLNIGCGSIGRRHMRVFQSLGVDRIAGVDTRDDRLEQAVEEIDIDATYTDLTAALEAEKPDIAIIATPPHIHTPIAIQAANAGANLFIEKPLAMNSAGLDDLEAVVAANNVCAYTAYCYRFIPSTERLKELVETKRIGKTLSVRLWISSYLPDWHPYEDYRSFYMAKKEQGGGALLDESHGVDLLRWIFGDVSKVSGFVGNVSDLEITSDDLAILLMHMKSGIPIEAHFDLLGRTPRIGMEIVGSDGTIVWDRIDPKIDIYDAETKEWTHETFDADDTVQSYTRQAKHFLECIASGSDPRTTIADGRGSLDVLLAGFEASENGTTVSVRNA